jgi:adenosine deaminase
VKPKIELHLHLEGAAPPAFIRGLARQRHIDLSGLFTEQGHYRFSDFRQFTKAHEAACTALQGPQDFHRLTLAVLEQSAQAGVVYTEVFLSPDVCGNRDLHAWREYLHAIQEAAHEAETQMGITLRGIAVALRHLGPERAREAALCAAETAGDFLLGFGLVGDEKVLKPKDFRWSFDCAREARLRLTANAGERDGPDSVRDALRDLAVERLGHGARAIEDLALVDELAERGTVLVLCPGANVALGLYPNVRKHPIGELFRRGVKVTVSTDHPAYVRTDMQREYQMLHDAFDWDDGVFDTLARTALDAAFCDVDTKEKVRKRLEATP